ncbi:MAG TPA: DUF120 domain-containing protein [Euryarchaeota archaeon]|nr:DUF120 domain-containing protein [Euryarchaeota archaeon]
MSPIIKVTGNVVTGVNKGSYYVRVYSDEIKKILGSEPYYGTLNVMVSEDDYNKVKSYAKGVIKGFERYGKKFYDVFYLRCRVKNVDGIIVFPTMGGHKNVLEIILPQKIDVKVGEEVSIEVYANDFA